MQTELQGSEATSLQTPTFCLYVLAWFWPLGWFWPLAWFWPLGSEISKKCTHVYGQLFNHHLYNQTIKALSHGAIFSGNLQLNSTFKRCKLVRNV